MRSYLKAAKERSDEPRLYVFNNCTQFIRTVPVLPRSERDPDDVDTAAEDHIGDESRYRIQMRKAVKTQTSQNIQPDWNSFL